MRRILFIVAILGLLVSGYLVITHVFGGPILCAGHGCETVRASSYSHLLGIPTPFYGIVFYLLLATGALLWSTQPGQVALPLLVLTGVGLAMSAWLTYLEAFVIHAWCLWCVASALLSLAAFGIVWYTVPKYYGSHH
jgi:uncharacterized membrane protein